MPLSFASTGTGSLAKGEPSRRRVLVTGAAGNIGSYFAEHSHDRYDLRLMVQREEDAEHLKGFGEVVVADLSDLSRLKEICQDMDTVLHLAGDASPNATWSSLLGANIIGTYNTFAAAKDANCRRVIYASSIHAVSGYPPDVQVKTNEPVNPGDLYGVTKCFGEALGRYMAQQEELSVIALRIGSFQPLDVAQGEGSIGMMDSFVSQRDLTQLIQRSIDVENIVFAVLHGVSNNRFKRLDISDARDLVGYEPQDDLTVENPTLSPLRLNERISKHNLGDETAKSGLREETAEE